jgi:23S rRNA (uracil1939-C5)-methyltransferase
MKRPRPHLNRAKSPESKLVQIEKPIYGGAFLARQEGKAIFVPLTLPGEQVKVRITEEKRSYATAEVEQIITAAPERVVPGCKHFGACGGCQYQHTDYETQLTLKQAILRETLNRGGVHPPESIDVLAAEPWQYRNRIRLAFDAAGNAGYRGRRSHALIPITECPIAAPLLVQSTLIAAELARKNPAFRPAEISLFCNAQETALLASVFMPSPARYPFDNFVRDLGERIPALQGAELVSEGQEGGPSRTVANWGEDSLSYETNGIAYRVDHGAFFQVNRWLTNQLVEQVTTGHAGAIAWDLFAGVGLFARPLTAKFSRVVAVESASAATRGLAQNLSGTTGIGVTAEILPFLRSRNISEQPDLIVVDPPRSGLGPETTALLAAIAAPTVVYVSCDPATLARDLRTLISSGYALQSVTLADLFPQTFHLETVVHLRRS